MAGALHTPRDAAAADSALRDAVPSATPPAAPLRCRVLAVRLDSDGDVLLTGPALRLLARSAVRLDLLASSAGAAAASLLPGIDEVLVFDAPWSGYAPPPVDAAEVEALVRRLVERRYDGCVIFTSFHQSPLPMALLARLAGISFVAATSVDYPGSLLDVRHRRPDGLHEVEAALDLARAALDGAGGTSTASTAGSSALASSTSTAVGGTSTSASSTSTAVGGTTTSDVRLAVRRPLPDVDHLVPDRPYVALHPGASVPSRALTTGHAGEIAAALVDAGRTVVVTGGPGERVAGAAVAAAGRATGVHDDTSVVDLCGRTSFAELAGVLAAADCVVVGNTGPAHLAAAVGTPVVSLFSPVVPAERWRPYGVPTALLGDQDAACRGSRARECPVAGHPCLTTVSPAEVVAAVDRLAPSLAGMTTTSNRGMPV